MLVPSTTAPKYDEHPGALVVGVGVGIGIGIDSDPDPVLPVRFIAEPLASLSEPREEAIPFVLRAAGE